MSETAIRVEGLGKRYRIGAVHARHPRGASLRRLLSALRPPGEGETLWALKDVSFQVERGEVIGIIGRNGAGKSTLLKILSRITQPTEGWADIHGRVGSLLEVGTGFHPELTGRENICLNGAILGMSRAEIDRKFDEIVSFAEVEKFIDTPVKRYSSGMYVRLAFAVAAHLEAEVLLIDEVLAVGDGPFQKKCLGKMGDAAREGRTVLFVSHNMGAVRMLCRRALCLSGGALVGAGPTDEVVQAYETASQAETSGVSWRAEDAPGNHKARLLGVRTMSRAHVRCASAPQPAGLFRRAEDVLVEVRFRVLAEGLRLNPHVHVFGPFGELLFISTNLHDAAHGRRRYGAGDYAALCRIPGHLLNTGRHYISVYLISDLNYWDAHVDRAVSMEVVEDGTDRGDYVGGWQGAVRPLLNWSVAKQ